MSFEFRKDDEIEEIVNHKTDHRETRCFEVKLKNVDRRVWIPLTSSRHRRILSENLIIDYYIRRNVRLEDLPPVSRPRRAEQLLELLSKVSDDELNQFARTFNGLHNLPASNMGALKARLLDCVPRVDDDSGGGGDDGEIQFSHFGIAQLRRDALIEVCHDRRPNQVRLLRQAEHALNVASECNEPILIENNVDLALYPRFEYVTDYVDGRGVRIERTPPDALGCGSDSASSAHGRHRCAKKCICMSVYTAKPAYNKDGQMILGAGELIHECNKKCRCDSGCRFRTIQNGCKVPLAIFRCSNDTGWGLRTLESVPRGTYVGRYVGRVITWEEAECLKAADGRKDYLFDIDMVVGDSGHCKWTVDAFDCANYTRFINHGCVPNLVVHHALTNSLDEDLHDLAFFTARPIVRGEELTFNYNKQFNDCRCSSYKCIQKRRP